LLDLGKEDIDVPATVASIKNATKAPIIAFCGHVATKELQEARDCGCDVVTTNGAITGSFETLIQQALTS
ncbi:MAG: AmiR/NasT family two-component response regulator, partial [Phycisphaerales bacterium]